jgi:phage/plasmid-associated DNA primase
MILLPFTVQIPRSEAVVGMDKREWWQEQGELPGILNWALAGLHDLRKQNGFVISASCQTAAEEQRAASSSPRRFLTENYQAGAGWKFKKDIYAEYCDWCKAHGCHSMGDIGFGRELNRVFPAVKDGKEPDPRTSRRGNTYVGLAVRGD